jgi:hypothetical protein
MSIENDDVSQPTKLKIVPKARPSAGNVVAFGEHNSKNGAMPQ